MVAGRFRSTAIRQGVPVQTRQSFRSTPCVMVLRFTRARRLISLPLKVKKCSIKHQKSTVTLIMIAAQESVIFIHVPKAAGTTLNRLIEWEYPLLEIYSVDPYFFRWSSAHLWRLPK